MDAKKEFLTQKEMCSVLGISRSTWNKYRIWEQIPPYKIGGKLKYKKNDIEKLKFTVR